MPKLTQRSVTALQVEPKDYFVWDATLPGFGVRVLPSGVKTYQVQYRKGARTRRAALGRHGTITTEEARAIARGMLGQVAGGLDPVEEIALERMAPTMAGLCDRFLELHVDVRLKPGTARDYRAQIRQRIKPALGCFKVTDVHRKDVAKAVRYDKRRYRRRNRIEIMFGRLKDWRRIATRYDRCAKVFLSAVALAATVMFWL